MSKPSRGGRRVAAPKPKPRTIDVELAGEYAGWRATARADFPARVLVDLQSGNIERVMAALDGILVDHNMPDADGNVAASCADVDPYGGLMELGAAVFRDLGKLPNR